MAKFENYTQHTEARFKSDLRYIGVVLIVCVCLFYYINFDAAVACIVISFIARLFYQAYKTRKCPKCKRTMKRDYSNGLIPENNYCEECRIVVSTGVVNGDGMG